MAKITQGPSPEDHYSMIPNALARSADLLPRAKTVYIFIRSHRTGWNLSTDRIADALAMSPTTVKAALRDLEDAGYVTRNRCQGGDGRFESWEYVVHSIPAAAVQNLYHGPWDRKPTVEKTDRGLSDPHKKTIPIKKTVGEEDQSPCSPPGGDGSQGELIPTSKAPVPQKQSGASSYPQAFEDWWELYPKKVGKQAALRAWKKACKVAGSGGLERALESHLPAMRPKELRFIPNPATWLNEGRYDDEPPAVQEKPRSSSSDVMAWFTPASGASASQSPTVVDAEVIEQRELGA